MTDVSLNDGLDDGRTPEAGFGDYLALLKPRVMSLVVFTALVGLLVAPAPVHPFVGFVAILCIAIGGGASGALNMWWDADIDARMKRTRGRPVPAGRVEAGEALGLGVALSGFSVLMLGLATNWFAASLLAFTIFFYAVVYTMWLKRSTAQNIVIGGLAGALPPLVGWVAATGAMALEPWLMVALVFMWTPPHFWALALFVRSDYGDAGVPMLTETHGARATRNHILAYALLLAPVALALGLTSVGGPIYLAGSIALNAAFVAGAARVWRRDQATAEADRFLAERKLFKLSLWYLFLHFGLLMVEATPLVVRLEGAVAWL
ncbi:heme o synthase [Wenxinia saemankumensis]|uniref:Protoheme IX farnesyltransferase n=1 Tax=Wenxinia saemankumensis TaxID=1447782 RepID=A0A1M6GVQ0_9RHOB|nr:heme o synthase [Wenxinia saemankumensis]SHJ14016.1 protoheme IX farnesyltransferase [Wenxinia saemankumensis]